MQETTKEITLGSTKVEITTHFSPGTKLFLLRLHGDETDAYEVGTWWVQNNGGTFVDIVSQKREIEFLWEGETIKVDPNRIFHKKGIIQTLRNLGTSPKPALVQEVSKLTEKILSSCFGKPCIVALHNNDKYNIGLYQKGGKLESGARDVYVNQNEHPHNLVLVSKKKDFLALKEKHINVVFLHDKEADYPGSFSDYCFQANVRYFNIETKLGKIEDQKRLLQEVYNVIASSS